MRQASSARGQALAMAVCVALLTRVASAQSGLPRTPDGKPDLQGIWQAVNTAAWDLRDHGARLGAPAGQGVIDGGEIPYQPWALEKQRENFANRAKADPEAKCYQPGVPRATYMGLPFQIAQTPKFISILYEYVHTYRIVHMGGKRPDEYQVWMGDSRGRWEGDTLVVDVANMTGQTWLDRAGNFHSDALHVVERYTLITPDHIDYEATLEDSKVFTRPWKIRMPLYRRKERNAQLLEYECYAYLGEEGGRR